MIKQDCKLVDIIVQQSCRTIQNAIVRFSLINVNWRKYDNISKNREIV